MYFLIAKLCISYLPKTQAENIVISDECEGILERRYQCENCGTKFKRVFEMFLEEEVKENRKTGVEQNKKWNSFEQ